MEVGREPGSLCLPLAPAEAGALGSLRIVPVRGSAMGLSLAGPSGVGLGLRALRCFACVDPFTDTSGFLYRPSFDRGLGRQRGLFCVDAKTALLGSQDTTPQGPTTLLSAEEKTIMEQFFTNAVCFRCEQSSNGCSSTTQTGYPSFPAPFQSVTRP